MTPKEAIIQDLSEYVNITVPQNSVITGSGALSQAANRNQRKRQAEPKIYHSKAAALPQLPTKIIIQIKDTNLCTSKLGNTLECEQPKTNPPNDSLALIMTPVESKGEAIRTNLSTSKSGLSHVRALDFDIIPGTEPILEQDSKNSNSASKTSKQSPINNMASPANVSKLLINTLTNNRNDKDMENKSETKIAIEDSGKNESENIVNQCSKEEGPWDNDLRILAGKWPDRPRAKRPRKKQRNKQSAKNKKTNLDSTEVEAQMIETNLMDDISSTSQNGSCDLEESEKSPRKNVTDIDTAPAATEIHLPVDALESESVPTSNTENKNEERILSNTLCGTNDKSQNVEGHELSKKDNNNQNNDKMNQNIGTDIADLGKITERISEFLNCDDDLHRFETPFKNAPPTPGSTIFTPRFTKAILQDVGVNSLETPKFILSPQFPYTPLVVEKTPFKTRCTDYSTSSSYYQPSDTEQNKSLENMVKEIENFTEELGMSGKVACDIACNSILLPYISVF